MIAFLRRLASGPDTLFECRHCGTKVGASVERCPNCEHDGIAVYRFD